MYLLNSMSRPSPCVYKKSSRQDSLAQKMLCALPSSDSATPESLDPSLVPHSPSGVSWAPGFNCLLHCCPETQCDAISSPDALRIKPTPLYPPLKALHQPAPIPLSSWAPGTCVHPYAPAVPPAQNASPSCSSTQMPTLTSPPLRSWSASRLGPCLQCTPSLFTAPHARHGHSSCHTVLLPLGYELLKSQYSTPSPAPGQR